MVVTNVSKDDTFENFCSAIVPMALSASADIIFLWRYCEAYSMVRQLWLFSISTACEHSRH